MTNITRVLSENLKGWDVAVWQGFLVGINPSSEVIIDGTFGPKTKEETILFQRKVFTDPSAYDGKVGPRTLGKALELGLNLYSDSSNDDSQHGWPPKPKTYPVSMADEREKIYGKIEYVADPQPNNKEAVKITNNWANDNIVSVVVPQLIGISGAPKSGKIYVHKKVADSLVKAFDQIEKQGLKDKLLTFGGAWVPRFIRGSRTVLSNHSWGTAIDLNVQWNMLGTTGALKGEKGSVRELVDIFYENEFYWGGWFDGRCDPMHFESFSKG
jgi:peptidoglycan hydrolase-like protein with peptidoglycan-binding domain